MRLLLLRLFDITSGFSGYTQTSGYDRSPANETR